MRNASHFVAVTLGAVACVLTWMLFNARQEVANTQRALERMSDHATQLEQQIVALEQEKQALQSQTIDGLIDRGSDSVVESWSEMADHFAREMERLGRVLEEQLDKNDSQEPDKNSKNPI